MNAHELARHLLDGPDLPVATHAHNHTYLSGPHEGPFKVAILETYAGQHILIGNPSKRNLNGPNWFISSFLVGSAPAGWPRFVEDDGRGHWEFSDE